MNLPNLPDDDMQSQYSSAYMEAVGRIIIAEDQLHNIQVIKQQMEEIGRKDMCEFVYNGQEAVIRFSELTLAGQYVSHVLTDFMMPRLNGIQTVQKIKEFIAERNS